MRASRITVLAVAALIAMPLTSVTAASASAVHPAMPAKFAAKDSGYGPTLAAAEQNARVTIEGDYGPCSGYYYYAYGQEANGTWWADVSAECSYYH